MNPLIAIALVYAVLMVIASVFAYFGIKFIRRAMNYDKNKADRVLENIMCGLWSGIIVGYLIEVKNTGITFVSIIISFAFLVFVVGIAMLITVSLISRKEESTANRGL